MTNTDNGWFKIHRKIVEWEWYQDTNTFRLFFHCLLMANHEDKKYRGKLVKRGSFLTGLQLLSSQTGLSVRSVRTALTKLKSTNELTIISSSQGSHIHIVKYELYQQVPSEATNERQTSDKRATTNKNYKNYKNKNIKGRKDDFIKTLQPFKEKYAADMLNDFFRYWTELSKDKSKMRFEAQSFWSISNRLATWKKKSKDEFTKGDQVESKMSITTGEYTR